jgi:predicted RNase H-like HicB family nuclease
MLREMSYHIADENQVLKIPSLWESEMVKSFKIIVEKHLDGYVAYPLGLRGVVVGEGSTHEEALIDVKSAIGFHIETFGPEVLDETSSALEVFIAETGVAV